MLTARDLSYDIYKESAPHLRVLKKQGQQKVTELTPLRATWAGSVYIGHDNEGDLYQISNGEVYFISLDNKINPLSGEVLESQTSVAKVTNGFSKNKKKYQFGELKMVDVMPGDIPANLRNVLNSAVKRDFPSYPLIGELRHG